jgi:uncharacterized repeat protein (TIGR01451 family)
MPFARLHAARLPVRAALVLLAAVLLAPPAGAAVTLRKQLDLRGDFKLFGNTLAQDRASGVVAPLVGTLCTTGNAGTCGTNTSDSGADVFWRAEPAVGATPGTAACNSTITAATARSVSVLQLPAGAVVKYARLYWAGYVSSNAYDATATLTPPGGAATPVAADLGWTLPTGETGRWWYQASADITALLQALPAAPGPYMVSDVDSITLAGVNSEVAFSGWWAVVFYEDPLEFTLRNLTLFDGFEGVSNGQAASATLAGFRVPAGGFDAKLGVVAWEGDASVSGDQLKFKGYTAPAAPPATLVSLTDLLNPANNFFNRSRSHLGAAVTVVGDLPQTSGAAGSLSGMDLDVVDLKANAAIASGNDSAVISATSTGDIYTLAGFITSIATLKPDFTNTEKSVVNIDRVGATLAGDRLEYTIVARNAGNDPSVQTVLTDALPPGITLVPGSLRVATGPNAGAKTEAAGDDQADFDAATRTLRVRLGTGATAAAGGSLAVGESTSVVFRATIDAGATGAVENQAFVTAAGQNGQPSTGFPSHPPTSGGGGGGGTITVVDACVTDLQCGGATPACDLAPAPNACVACTSDGYCGGTTPICDLAARACVGRSALSPLAQERPAAPGLAVPFDLLLQTHQSVAERFNLDVLDGGCASALELRDTAGVLASRDAAGAWTIVAGSDLDADGRPDFAAPAAGSFPFTLRLTQSAGAAVGERCLAQVVVTGFVTGAAAPVSVAVRATAAATFTPDRTGAGALTVGSGGRVAFSGVIQNNGAVATAFTLAATVTATPAAGALAAPQLWSDPNGDGDPADGAPIAATGPVAPFGGTVPVVLVLQASTGAGAPLPAGLLLTAQATATAVADGTTATQQGEAWVGWLVPSADAAFATSAQVFAPCETIHVRAQRLPVADGYALEWYVGSAPVRGVDQPFRTVDPWPVTGGSASDAWPVPAGTPDAVTLLLVQRSGAASAVLDTLPIGLERGGAIASLTAPTRTVQGQPLSASATFRSDALRVTHRGSSLAWTVSGGGQAMDGTGAFVTPPATARLRSGVEVAPGATTSDALSATPAWPAPGRYQVSVAWQLACGATPALAEGSSDVDVAPPAPTIVTPASGALLATATPAVSGTALPGASVLVSIDGVALPAVTAAATGHFVAPVPAAAPLSEGEHLAVAVQTVASLASDPTAPVAFSTDSLPPSLQLTAPAPGTLFSAATAPGGQVAFAGSAEAGAAVTLAVDGKALTVLRAGAAFTASATLGDGTHRADVTATDAAGNAAALLVLFDLDATAPSAPVVATPVAGQVLGGALAPAGLVEFSGTAEPGSSVTVTVGAASVTVLAAGGTFHAALLLPDGDHDALVTATDGTGNVSSPARVHFRLDTLAPAAPAALAPAAGQLLDAAQAPGGLVGFTGTAEAGSAVTISVGTSSTTVATVGTAFAGSLQLTDGDQVAQLTATDAAGNVSATATVAFSLDTVAPTTPGISAPTAGLLLGAAQAPGGLVQFSGAAEAGSSVTVTVGAASITVPTAGSAYGAALLLADGEHDAQVTASDAAGNRSAAATVHFSLDTLPPAAPVIVTPVPGAELQAGVVVVAGTAEPGSSLQVSIGALSSTALVGPDGLFSRSFELTAGAQSAVAVATDAAGNGSPERQVAFAVVGGTTPPRPAPRAAGGCGCSQGAGAAGGSSLLLLALAALWPRRRGARAGRRS